MSITGTVNTVLVVFTSAYAIYILTQLWAWIKTPSSQTLAANFKTKVSVIIPCRNEEKNIAACLESVLAQNYPISLLEIIVADDYSEDNTGKISEEILSKSLVAWKYIKVKEPVSNKKKAIEAGINESGGELIIITDADCTASKNWVASIVSLYEEKKCRMICGPVAITGEKGFCGKFQSLEVSGLSLLAGAGIFSHAPLLANGANIAYTREAYDKVGGFEGIKNTPSGDDTLLLFKINMQFPGQIGYLKNRESIVYTREQTGWKNFLQQRLRWASKGFKSKNYLNSLVSALVFVTNSLMFIYIIASLVSFSFNLTIMYCLFLKFTIDFLLLTCATDFFKRRDLLLYFLAGEFVTMIYVSWVGLAANFSSYHWKGRDY
ncbi:MAG: glycosyltransferase [Bacteroidia bacterium]